MKAFILFAALWTSAAFAQSPLPEPSPPPLLPADEPEPRAPLPSEGVASPPSATSFAEPQRNDVLRIGLELLLGGLGEMGLGVVGAYTGCAVTPPTGDVFGCLGAAVGGALIGGTIGAALGVTAAGALFGREGLFIGALGGSVIGLLSGGLLIAALASANDAGAVVGGVALLTLPVVGAIVGYEWTSTGDQPQRLPSRALFVPTAASTRDGRGVSFGVGGFF
ncbi:MAG: hypothetical protein ACOZIN_16000 [Myxococcota bacterium]